MSFVIIWVEWPRNITWKRSQFANWQNLYEVYGRKDMDALYQLMRLLLSLKSYSKLIKNIVKVKDVVYSKQFGHKKKRLTVHLLNHQEEVLGCRVKAMKIPPPKSLLRQPSWIFRAKINNNLMKLWSIREHHQFLWTASFHLTLGKMNGSKIMDVNYSISHQRCSSLSIDFHSLFSFHKEWNESSKN